MDWFKGKSTGNPRCSYGVWAFPVIIPLNQSVEGICYAKIPVQKLQLLPFEPEVAVIVSSKICLTRPAGRKLLSQNATQRWHFRETSPTNMGISWGYHGDTMGT